MDTNFISTYLLSQQDPAHVDRATKKLNDSSVIFFPICIEHHWSLFVLCIKSKVCAYLMHLNSLNMDNFSRKNEWSAEFGRHATAIQKYSATICNVDKVPLYEQLIGESKVFTHLNPFCNGLPMSS